LLESFSIGDRRRGMHLLDEPIVVIVEVGEGHVDLLGSEIRMLAQNLFGGPTVMVMLPGQVEHLVPAPFDPSSSIGVEGQVGIVSRRAHDCHFNVNPISLVCARAEISWEGEAA